MRLQSSRRRHCLCGARGKLRASQEECQGVFISRNYLDTWIDSFQGLFADVDVLSIRPVCVPGVEVTDALQVEVLLVTQEGLAPYRERWLTSFHGGLAYFMEGYAWDTSWDDREKYIDSLMFSFHFD